MSMTLIGLLDLALIVAVSRALGALCTRIHQPPVIGEIMGGILLGPSLLGWLAPNLSHVLFPPPAVELLGNLSQVGLVLFMFTVGAASHANDPQQGRRAAVISAGSIVLPFGLGCAIGLALAPVFPGRIASPQLFGAFMGAAMSVTAFPVLARILSNRGMLKTPVGALAIACAAVDDVAAWLMLAAITAGASGARRGTSFLFVAGLFAAWLVVMILVVRPAVQRLWTRWLEARSENTGALAFVIVLALASGAVTESIGVHALFGAFFAGVMMPRSPRLAALLAARVEPLVSVLLLPVFFAFTGLRTNFRALSSPAMLRWAVIVIAAAIVGKLAGAMITARLTGVSWRHSAVVGVLLNTRGLVELVVLNVGLDLGILPPELFSVMVVMALVTTFMAAPALSLLAERSPVTH
jgi:Kef-type K+ transport system membrane component KefB